MRASFWITVAAAHLAACRPAAVLLLLLFLTWSLNILAVLCRLHILIQEYRGVWVRNLGCCASHRGIKAVFTLFCYWRLKKRFAITKMFQSLNLKYLQFLDCVNIFFFWLPRLFRILLQPGCWPHPRRDFGHALWDQLYSVPFQTCRRFNKSISFSRSLNPQGFYLSQKTKG